MTRDSRIHLYAPNMFEYKGGIQAFSQFLLEALVQTGAASEIHVFLKHDRAPSEVLAADSRLHFYCCGACPGPLRTLLFIVRALVCACLKRPDLVITTHVNFSPLCWFVSRIRQTRYWIVAHGVEVWKISAWFKRYALTRADKILPVSTFTRSRLEEEYGYPPERVEILPNTFREEHFEVREKPGDLLARHYLQSDQPIILTVARLDSDLRYKGYDLIIESLPKVIDRIPRVHYLLLGKGGDESRIRELVRELHLEQHVTLTGFVPDDELGKYYNLCDLFAMPSQGEGFGIVFLEALASGKPCVSGNRDGSRDPLGAGTRGVQVPPDDGELLAETLVAILTRRYPNAMLYQPQALRESVVREFGFDSFKDRVRALIGRELSR